ncbi:hypothetical protein NY486_04735, partial [Enterobacter hormaechei]|nr:hypothetical protein [Enterobacter hormaechei]
QPSFGFGQGNPPPFGQAASSSHSGGPTPVPKPSVVVSGAERVLAPVLALAGVVVVAVVM